MVETKVQGTCVSKNGEFDIGSVTLELRPDGKVSIGFVSSRLHRKLNAGATIDAASMDRMASEWVKMRSLKSV